MAHGNLSGGLDATNDAQSAMDGQLCFSPIALTSIELMAFMLIQLYYGSLNCLLRDAVYFQNISAHVTGKGVNYDKYFARGYTNR